MIVGGEKRYRSSGPAQPPRCINPGGQPECHQVRGDDSIRETTHLLERLYANATPLSKLFQTIFHQDTVFIDKGYHIRNSAQGNQVKAFFQIGHRPPLPEPLIL